MNQHEGGDEPDANENMEINPEAGENRGGDDDEEEVNIKCTDCCRLICIGSILVPLLLTIAQEGFGSNYI